MPDTPTATPADSGSGESAAAYESEFSHPVGKEDSAVWEKHFGEKAKWPKENEDRGRGKADREASEKPRAKSSESSAKSSKSSSGDSKSASDNSTNGKRESKEKSGKDSDDSTDSSRRSAKPAASTDTDKSSTPKEPKSPKKDDASEATGQRTAEREEEGGDSETPDAKATYAKAKAEKDVPKARKLYRQAMQEAFGEVPDEFNDGKLAAIRKRHADTERGLAQQKQQNEQRIQDAVKQLQPAIAIMRKVKDAGIGDYTMAQLDHAVEVMAELRRLEQGDYTGLAQLVSKAAKVDPEEAMKRFVRGVKVSPEGQAVRAAAKAAEERAATAERQVQELARKLQEREQQQGEAQKQAERKAAIEARRAEYTAEVESELEGHPVLKLERGVQRVVAQLIKTADPKTRTARYSPTRVADAIVAAEKKRAAQVAALDGDGDEQQPRSGTRTPNPSRRESAENGVPNPDPMARFDAIWEKHTPKRAAGGRR